MFTYTDFLSANHVAVAQCMNFGDASEKIQLMFESCVTIENKCDLSDFDHGTIVNG